MKFTHKKLVDVAYDWVLKNTSCGFAVKELKTLESENPDVLGFGSNQHSVLIEVKVSRCDFLADRKKPFRQNPNIGIGTQRFYCCPTDLIKQNELPIGWGLIYVNDNLKTIIVFKPYKGNIGERCDGFKEKNKSAENSIMYSVLRRLQNKGLLKEIYSKV